MEKIIYDEKIEITLSKFITYVNYCIIAYATLPVKTDLNNTDLNLLKQIDELKEDFSANGDLLISIGKTNQKFANNIIKKAKYSIPLYSKDRKLDDKQANMLHKYYEFYNKKGKDTLTKETDIFKSLSETLKTKTNKQLEDVKFYNDTFDRIVNYIKTLQLFNSVYTIVNTTENINDIQTKFNENKITDNINIIKQNIKKFKQTINMGLEFDIEQLINKGFNVVDKIDDTIYKKGISQEDIQNLYNKKSIEYETNLSNIKNDLKKLIDKLVKKLQDKKKLIDTISDNYNKIANSKFVKMILDIGGEIPFFKNFIDLGSDIKNINNNVIQTWDKIKKTLYISNKIYLKNNVVFLLSQDQMKYNANVGYWNYKLLFDNLDKNKTDKQLQKLIEQIIKEFIHKGNAKLTPIYPLLRQFIINSDLNNKSIVNYKKNDNVIIIVDNTINSNIEHMGLAKGIINNIDNLDNRKYINVEYKIKDKYYTIKLFLESYRLWLKSELQLINSMDNKIKDEFLMSLLKNYKEYKKINKDTLNKSNFITYFKKAIKTSKIINEDKNLENLQDLYLYDNTRYKKVIDNIQQEWNNTNNIINRIKQTYKVNKINNKILQEWNILSTKLNKYNLILDKNKYINIKKQIQYIDNIDNIDNIKGDLL